jgi:hypothetical protein
MEDRVVQAINLIAYLQDPYHELAGLATACGISSGSGGVEMVCLKVAALTLYSLQHRKSNSMVFT